MRGVPVITIDGPSGSGKGTIARRLAGELGFHWLDSGALYRCVALKARFEGVSWADESALEALIPKLQLNFTEDAQGNECITINDVDVSREIRTEEAAAGASQVAALPKVRAALLAYQHAQRRSPGLIADGRDMGTVVFADAPVKIFLTASAEARALRRYKQLNDKGQTVILADLVREIAERDERDANRVVAPLKPASDAIVVDSTNLNIDQVMAKVRAFAASIVVNE